MMPNVALVLDLQIVQEIGGFRVKEVQLWEYTVIDLFHSPPSSIEKGIPKVQTDEINLQYLENLECPKRGSKEPWNLDLKMVLHEEIIPSQSQILLGFVLSWHGSSYQVGLWVLQAYHEWWAIHPLHAPNQLPGLSYTLPQYLSSFTQRKKRLHEVPMYYKPSPRN